MSRLWDRYGTRVAQPLPVVTLFMLVLFAIPGIILPVDSDGGLSGRFSVELFGGAAILNPRDLNLRPDCDNRLQEFQYDTFLDYWQAQGNILSWNKAGGAGRRRIRTGVPLGLRARYRISRPVSVSVSLSYFTAAESEDLLFEYNRRQPDGSQYRETLQFSPYALSLSAFIPQVGVHCETSLSRALSLEGFVCVGPVFSRCRFLSDWSYAWRILGSGYDWLMFMDTGRLEEKGTGTGLGAEAAVRLSYRLARRVGLFVAAGYAYQKIMDISGKGSERWGESRQEWEGTWAIKKERIAAPWGEVEVEFPTAYWPETASAQKVRDFELDLSGFQLKLGLSYAF